MSREPGAINYVSNDRSCLLRAYSRRVGDGDVEALAMMFGLAEKIDTAIAEAVKDLRACGYSWAEIGSRLPARHLPPGRTAALGGCAMRQAGQALIEA